MASVLSGANKKVYPIGFMISNGNEDGPTDKNAWAFERSMPNSVGTKF